MQYLDMFGGKPKGSESDDDEDELVRKNTRINSATGAALPDEVVSESDAESNAESKTNGSSDADTDADTDIETDTNTDASGESELTLDEDDEIAIETPAMIAKKTATAASALANSDSKKKTTKRVVKGKATLQDITTLQQSYDDLELNEDGDTNDSEGDDDDSDDGTNYLRKFDSEMRENYIATHHHEMMQLNMAEVDSLVRVVRNADGMIVDGIHKTMPFLTKYEKTRILGQRAKQLNQGAQPVIPIDKKIIDGYLIAQLELQQKALPFIIRRPLPGGKSEYWRLADLELI